MRRILVALSVWASFHFASLRAEEPHLDLVRGLRSRGMADLAVDYLLRLSEHPPDSIKAMLPLELAKARLDLAAAEGNEKKRAKQFDEARAAFEGFLKANPNHPLAADAALDVARLVAFQGKHLLAQARRADDPAARKNLTARARPLFADAATRLAAAAQQIDTLLSRLAAPATPEDQALKSSLTQAKLQAELESGINLLNVALTMPDNSGAEIKARATAIEKAKAALEKLTSVSEDNPVHWTAQLWIARCLDELDSKADARRLFDYIVTAKSPAAEEAARSAAFLALRSAAEDRQATNRAEQIKNVIAGIEEWLKKNQAARNTADGQAARYLLAVLLEEQAQSVTARDKPSGPARLSPSTRAQLTRIERLLKEIIDADGEYAERSRQRRVGILVALLGERATGDIKQLVSFEECYLTAQIEAFELTQAKKSASDRANHYTRIVAALRRGISLASRADSPRDVADARAMLAYTYLAGGDPYSAAVFGEFVGRSDLGGTRSAEATAYALQGYAAIVALGREHGETEDDLKPDQRRLRSLAEYMEKNWPDEPATDFARHQLGSLLLDDHNYVDAIAMLARIAPSYPGLAQARYQQGAAAQRAQAKDVNLPAEQKKVLLKQAMSSLKQLPDPMPGQSEDSTLAICMAKCQLGNLYLYDESPSGANFVKAAELGRALTALAPTLSLESKVRPQVEVEAAKLVLAGVQSRAFLLVQANQLEAARLVLKPLYERVRGEILAPKPPDYAAEAWYESYRETQRQVVALALRLAIQENQAEQAHQALDLLRRASGQLENANDRLLRLVYDLKREADEYKKKGETDKRDKLEKGLVAFLDELARPKNLADDVRLFLAQAYGGLDRHDRAADLLAGYPAPKNAADEAVTRYQNIRLSLAREYRLARQIENAKTVLQEILGSWGKTDLAVRREKVFLLEDAGNYGAAVQECREIKKALLQSRIDFERGVREEKAADDAERTAANDEARQKAAQDRATAQAKKNGAQALRERYWEFDFYDTRIVLKSSQKVPDPAVREQKIAAVAVNIKRLEDAHPDVVGKELREKFLELFELEPLLKRKYVEAEGKVLVTS